MVEKNLKKNILWHMNIIGNSKFSIHKVFLDCSLCPSPSYNLFLEPLVNPYNHIQHLTVLTYWHTHMHMCTCILICKPCLPYFGRMICISLRQFCLISLLQIFLGLTLINFKLLFFMVLSLSSFPIFNFPKF